MMFILIEDYFITTQVFNLVFYRGRGGGEVNTVVIVKNAKRKKKKRTWPIFSYLDLTLG